MARKRSGARRTRGSAAKDVRLEFDIASPMPNLVHNLEVVNRRLAHVEDWIARFHDEGVSLTRAEYARRLRDRKRALTSEIEKQSKQRKAASGAPAAHMTPAQHLADMRAKIDHGLLTPLTGPCPTLIGHATPGPLTQARNASDSINHGSWVRHGYDDTHLATYGVCIVDSQLHDKASIWRDDDPDYTAVAYDLVWRLPPAVCSSAYIETSIPFSAHLEFTNGADDGGAFQALCALASGDVFGGPTTYVFSASDVVAEGRATGTYHVAQFVLDTHSAVAKGHTQFIQFCFLLRLWAQDGQVGVVGSFTLDSGPTLQYLISPFNCFISTAIYQALGKGDDCSELTVLRRFRDSYVRSRPGGAELIAAYYRDAPAIMRKLMRREGSRGILLAAYDRYLRKAVEDITGGRLESAFARYTSMMKWLEGMSAHSG